MPRILFTKTGDAVWISHLDLMRLFQRAFKRAGLPLTHTQGYNPRPSVSIALPLSVGVESVCELLDFDLEGETVPCDEITRRLNDVLVPGIRVLETYDNGLKIRDLAVMDCALKMEYDNGIPEGARDAILALFKRESLMVEKKSKNGLTQQDIIPMIKQIGFQQHGDHTLVLFARICCQNPTLNPAQMTAAIINYLPQYAPDFVTYRRLEIFTPQEKPFR
jgi:radical SAM-linked protein